MVWKSLAIIVLLALVAPPGVTWARKDEIKKPCSNCHTMHNSQGGSPMAGTTLRSALLTNSCYGCHTGDNSITGMPMVLKTGGVAPAQILAGGSFYWVAQVGNDLKGHNVGGFTDQVARTPPGEPGGDRIFDANTPLACAGINGCHGDLSASTDIFAIYQTHHAVEPAQPMDGSPLAESFRLLNGIAGLEDLDYEFTVSSSDHNQYKGAARIADTDADTTTISHLCAKCHGDFHSGAGDAGTDGATFGSPWLRHPVDYVMGLTGEYAGYGGAGVNAYDILVPLGSDDIPSTPKSVVSGANDSIIICLSCHRAHGSPYDYSLRWDYKAWPSAGYNGCGLCHTAKN